MGGPLSAALITTLDGRLGLAGWQWMFLVEGLPCVLLGLLTLRVLPDRAADARWLDAEEKQRIEAEIAAPHLHERGFGRALRDLAIYRLAIAYFSLIAAIYAISFWLPTLLKARGATNLITLGWYSAIPYLAAAIGMTWIGRRSGSHRRAPLPRGGAGLRGGPGTGRGDALRRATADRAGPADAGHRRAVDGLHGVLGDSLELHQGCRGSRGDRADQHHRPVRRLLGPGQ